MSIDYKKYFSRYIDLVKEEEIDIALTKNHSNCMKLISSIDEEKATYRYGEDKWSIKELLSHIIDTERIFSYRALRFARNDQTELAGYDENHFAIFSGADDRPFKDIVKEFDYTRLSSIAMYSSFNKEMRTRSGRANGVEIDVSSLAYLISGHCQHHLNILEKRYLS